MRLLRLIGLAVIVAVIPNVPADASIITYDDGVCVERGDFSSVDCIQWDGPDGFFVRGDMTTWTSRNDSFRLGFRVITGTPGTDSTQMVFMRDAPFDLLALNLWFPGDLPVECPYPVEIRSSKGAHMIVEPPRGGPDTMCYQYTATAFDVFPYSWTSGDLTLDFTGFEWRDIDWFYIGFTPGLWIDPRPKISEFSVESIRYVPELKPSALWMFGIVLFAAVTKARHMRHAFVNKTR